MAGLAQARGQVHQTGQHDAARGVHHALGRKVGRHTVDADNAARRNRDVTDLVEARSGVDHTAVLDQYLHDFKPNWLLALIQ
ncbi:hypothetical protein D3C86_2072860 [compost metagenome]